MPFIQISIKKGKSEEYHGTVIKEVYHAMRETFDVPEDDLFATLKEFDDNTFIYDRNYMNIERSDDFMIIQITARNSRTVDQKKALYKEITNKLEHKLQVRPQDVFINLVEVDKANWSFGNGIAHYA